MREDDSIFAFTIEVRLNPAAVLGWKKYGFLGECEEGEQTDQGREELGH